MNKSIPPLSISGLSYLFIRVHDLEKMLHFYREVLGLRVYYEEVGEMAFLEAGGTAVALYTGRQTEITPESHWLIAFDVPDLITAVATLTAHSIPVSPIVAIPSGRYAQFRDPEGNQLEIHQANAP